MGFAKLIGGAFVLFLCLSNAPYEKGSGKVERELVGEWMMGKVYVDGLDLTEQHNPMDSRWVRFSEDKAFASGGNPFPTLTGTWELDENASTLSINMSDASASRWKIRLNGDRLVWTAHEGNDRHEFKIILYRNSREF